MSRASPYEWGGRSKFDSVTRRSGDEGSSQRSVPSVVHLPYVVALEEMPIPQPVSFLNRLGAINLLYM